MDPKMSLTTWLSVMFSCQFCGFKKISSTIQLEVLVSEMSCKVRWKKWARENTKCLSIWQCFMIPEGFLMTIWHSQSSFPESFSTLKKNLKRFMRFVRTWRLMFWASSFWMDSNSWRCWFFCEALVLHPLKNAWMMTALWFCLLKSWVEENVSNIMSLT